MSEAALGSFDALVRLHRSLICDPDARPVDSALRPARVEEAEAWTWVPTFELIPYRCVDPIALALALAPEGTASFHDLSDDRLDGAIRHVVEVEGPIHWRVLAERLLDAAGVTRLGSRIRERIEERVEALEQRGDLIQQGPFVGRASQLRVPRLRDWSALPDEIRDLDHVPDTELMLALFRAVLDADDAEGIPADQAMNDGIHRMGFVRLTRNARERLQAPLEALLREGMLRLQRGSLHLGRDAFLRSAESAAGDPGPGRVGTAASDVVLESRPPLDAAELRTIRD